MARGCKRSFVFAVFFISLLSSWSIGLAQDLTPLELRQLLLAEEFATLEKSLQQTQARFESGQESDWIMATAMRAFETSDPAVGAALNTWNERFPESHFALLARAHHNWYIAWMVPSAPR